MAILIKGMEMPTRCWDCPFWMRGHDESYCDLTQKDVPRWTPTPRPADCPLVEVPTPHGRLIDADRLPICREYSDGYEFHAVYEEDLNAAPTVIEAEE